MHWGAARFFPWKNQNEPCSFHVKQSLASVAPSSMGLRTFNVQINMSVHIAEFPKMCDLRIGDDVLIKMDLLRSVCNAASSIRKKRNIRARMPLQSLKIYGDGMDFLRSKDYSEIVKDEINVKHIEIVSGKECDGYLSKTIKLDFKTLGMNFGRETQKVATLVKNNLYSFNESGDVVLPNGLGIVAKSMFEVVYLPSSNLVLDDKAEDFAVFDANRFLILDIQINPELEKEAIARDFIRCVQSERKLMSLNISDKIMISYYANDVLTQEAISSNAKIIAQATIANDILLVRSELESVSAYTINDAQCFIKLQYVKN